MGSSKLQVAAILVIFSLVITAQSENTEGACHFRGECNKHADCVKQCHGPNDPPTMSGFCVSNPSGAPGSGSVCCCLFD